MSATKELMLEACENIGLDATMCAEWSPATLAAVQCEMGRILGADTNAVVTSDVNAGRRLPVLKGERNE